MKTTKTTKTVDTKATVRTEENFEMKLVYPVMCADGRVMDRVTLRRLKIRDLKMVANQVTEEQKLFALLPHLMQEAPEDIENLDAQDWIRIRDKIADFLGGATGGGL